MRPGAPSVNPSGRPKGAAGLARYVAEQTNDMRELVDRLLELSRDEDTPIRERLHATFALLDRGAGKPLQPQEIALAHWDATPSIASALPPQVAFTILAAIREARALPAPAPVPVEGEDADASG